MDRKRYKDDEGDRMPSGESLVDRNRSAGDVSALSTYGPRLLRSIPPFARDGAGLITWPCAVQPERQA